MKKIVEKSLLAFDEAPSHIKVTPAVPIAYFGNLPAYLNSRKRIVTVGLNPSDKEFPREDPFLRFPMAESGRKVDILNALNQYFQKHPYKTWFDRLEPLLNSFSASYYGKTQNTAIHTDILSPVATSPTWSGLTRALGKPRVERMAELGLDVWHDLMNHIVPDVILISVAKQHIERIRFHWASPLVEVANFGHTRKKAVYSGKLQIGTHTATVYYCQAAQTPFGFLSAEEKRNFLVFANA